MMTIVASVEVINGVRMLRKRYMFFGAVVWETLECVAVDCSMSDV